MRSPCIFLLVTFFAVVHSYGEDVPQAGSNITKPASSALQEGAAQGKHEEIAAGVVNAVSAAVQRGDHEAVRAMISRQYMESGEKIKKLLESNGQDTSGFNKRILKDFDFFSVVGVGNVELFDDVAFVETKVVYKPAFVAGREKLAGQTQQAKSLWNTMGGKIFAQEWEENGTGVGTFYLVRQNDLWKLHCVYFSSKPLSKDDVATARDLMKELVGPNTL